MVVLGLTLHAVIAQETENIRHFFVGTYTDGESEGIYRFGLDIQSGMLHFDGLSAMSENPSYLAITGDGKKMIAVHEVIENTETPVSYIELFSVGEKGTLTSLNKVYSGGAHPCFVSVNPEGYVLAANYTSGTVALFEIDKQGMLSDTLNVKQHFGKGLNAKRQEKPHVHSAYFEPGANRAFVADLGIDKVKIYGIDTVSRKLVVCKYPEIKLPPGSGPRHLAFYPEKKMLYVVNELTCTVAPVILADDGSFKLLQAVSTLPEDFKSENTCADIHLSPDGRFLYVSNRGLNSIAIFEVSPSGRELKLIGQEPVRGETPRNFTLSPDGDYLLVANQNSNNIVSFKRDVLSGKLTFIDEINAQKPVCLLFGPK